MSSTTAGSLKVLIESAGLGLAAYRDFAPEGERFPYVTVSDGISTIPEQHGDQGDPTADHAVTELAQVDLWERLRGSTSWQGHPDDPDESFALVSDLLTVLHGATLGPTSAAHTYGCTVDDALRLVEHDRAVVHTAITVRLRRRMLARGDT